MGLVDAWFSAAARGDFQPARGAPAQPTAQQLAVTRLRVYQSKKKKERAVFKFKVSDPALWAVAPDREVLVVSNSGFRAVRLELHHGDREIAEELIRCGWWFRWRLARAKRRMLRRALTIARARTDVFLTPGGGFKEAQRPNGEE